MKRWWIYQKERFPIFAHGPLIAAFSACAVAFSSMLRDAEPPSWSHYLTAFVVCFLMFLQLRIADEFKDHKEDSRWRPYRPVPRGLVKLSELRILFILAAFIQLGVSLLLDPLLIIVLAIAWTYLALMSVEFFCRDWLKGKPVIYLISHMGIMPLVDWFGTACEWLPRASENTSGLGSPEGLGWFLTASFCNGVVIELGRKLRQPKAEEEGVETYSALWGKRSAAGAWLFAMAATWICAVFAGLRIGFALPLGVALGLLLVIAILLALRYARRNLKGKHLEGLTAIWTLVLYLMLGLIPLYLAS
ncbi:MAG: UbiA family prenyltransferase [Akkermansiaceae bacterium]|nr:UbiA family prenyltransferase [Akkermansiaceae bacterium]